MIKIDNLNKNFFKNNTTSDITIGYSMLEISLPIFIAIKKNFFKKNNLNINLKKFDTAQPLINSLVNGNIDAGGYTALPISLSKMEEKEMYFLTSVLESKDSKISYFLRRSGCDIKEWKGLKGKKIGILPTAAYKIWVEKILEKNKVDIFDVEIIEVDVLDQVNFLKSGKIDFLFTNNPVAASAIELGVGVEFSEENNLLDIFGGEYIFGSFNINKKFSDENIEVVANLKKTLDQAIEFIEKHPKKSRKILRYFLGEKNHILKYKNLKYKKDNLECLVGIKSVSEKLYQFGFLKKMINMNKYVISLEDESKIFGEKKIFSNFNLEIKKGEVVGLFGSNGTGKSTILNMIYGLDNNFSGNILKKTKNISYVYQKPNDVLLPWFTSKENIFLACDGKNIPRDVAEKKIKNMSNLLNIDFSLYSYPFELSGGQQQIIVIMRALIVEPDILLMDDPFAALDIEKRINIIELLKKNKTTTIITSHRGEEVVEVIDRAIIFESQPVKKSKDMYKVKDIDFIKKVKEIRFNKHVI